MAFLTLNLGYQCMGITQNYIKKLLIFLSD